MSDIRNLPASGAQENSAVSEASKNFRPSDYYAQSFPHDPLLISSLLWEIRDCLLEYNLSSISNGLNNTYRKFGVRNDKAEGKSFGSEKKEFLRSICRDIRRTHATEFNLKLFEMQQTRKKLDAVEKMLRKNKHVSLANQTETISACLQEICKDGKFIMNSADRIYKMTGEPIVKGTGVTVEEFTEKIFKNINNG